MDDFGKRRKKSWESDDDDDGYNTKLNCIVHYVTNKKWQREKEKKKKTKSKEKEGCYTCWLCFNCESCLIKGSQYYDNYHFLAV